MNYVDKICDLETACLKDLKRIEKFIECLDGIPDFIFISNDDIIVFVFVDDDWMDHFEFYGDDSFTMWSRYLKLHYERR